MPKTTRLPDRIHRVPFEHVGRNASAQVLLHVRLERVGRAREFAQPVGVGLDELGIGDAREGEDGREKLVGEVLDCSHNRVM